MPELRPSHEADRLAAVHTYGFDDTAADLLLAEVVELAAHLTDSPFAAVTVVEAERVSFKASVGFSTAQLPRHETFCTHLVADPRQPLLVHDARHDRRFDRAPVLLGDVELRAYLGVPLLNADNFALGTLCVLDRRRRDYRPSAIRRLSTLAQTVVTKFELQRASRRLRSTAQTDTVTGLPNRIAAEKMLADLPPRSGSMSVIVIGLDYLDEANDAAGSPAGDALLAEAARRLRTSVRAGDFLARIDGSRFVVMMKGVRERKDLKSIALRISTAIHKPVCFAGSLLRLGATIGVAAGEVVAARPGALLRDAEAALQAVRRHRRGGIGWASADTGRHIARVASVLRAFDRPVLDGQLPETSVALQPILDLQDGAPDGLHAVSSLEALVRWHHPLIGPVPPHELLAAIGPERTVLLGQAVRRQALAAVARLRAEGLSQARLAVNLSAGEVAHPSICAMLLRELREVGLAPSDLEIEITEEVLLDEVSKRTRSQLRSLQDLGARLVLDDFGTGHSGLSQLLRLPLDGVKLDKRFVRDICSDPHAAAIVQTTATLAHALGLTTVAEGIEHPGQAEALHAMGYDAVQGFHFARPMAPVALEEWLRNRVRGGTTTVAVRERH